MPAKTNELVEPVVEIMTSQVMIEEEFNFDFDPELEARITAYGERAAARRNMPTIHDSGIAKLEKQTAGAKLEGARYYRRSRGFAADLISRIPDREVRMFGDLAKARLADTEAKQHQSLKFHREAEAPIETRKNRILPFLGSLIKTAAKSFMGEPTPQSRQRHFSSNPRTA